MLIQEDQSVISSNLYKSLPFGVVFIGKDNMYLPLNEINEGLLVDKKVNEYVQIVKETNKAKVGIELDFERQNYYLDFLPIMDKKIKLKGVLILARPEEKLGEYWERYQTYKEMSRDLQAIFDSSYDVLYVSDSKGKTLRASSACEWIWGKSEKELIGKTIWDLEKERVYSPSATRLVLEKKEKVSVIQTTNTGRRLMVVGTPIKNENGDIVRIVNASRDITEVSQLQSELSEMKKLIDGYKRELTELRKQVDVEQSVIYKSQCMKNVLHLAKKVAHVDSTVLILGESGVGKEVIANYILQHSQRNNKPFLKINCGAIPENLLESELFGYERGAFTGANQSGKPGLFELANEGTIFLDELGEMPPSLQVKLLRVLQEQELMRVGGSKPVKVNVRLIAATNKDLEEEVKKGNFREDLYYRLNVIPIVIPSLRNRRDDIIPIAKHFIDHYNQKYLTNKTLSTPVLNALQQYKWPGNVRELQNIIERLVIISEENEVTISDLPDGFVKPYIKDTIVEVHDILPLKDCIELAERQLLNLAMSKFSTAVDIAKALKVDQSTVSRKMKKLF